MTLIEKHLYPQKKEWWGDGEWVNEPDLVEFEHEGIKCLVIRVIGKEKSGFMFGGHLCGYCLLTPDHPWFGKDYEDMNIEVHGGLTWSNHHEGFWKVGFDCAHAFDLIPSMEHLYKTDPNMISIAEIFPKLDNFEDVYRNMEVVIEETKIMAEQMAAKLGSK